MDGSVVNKKAFMRATAYVVQSDLYHPTSTVKEAVLFQANLRCADAWVMLWPSLATTLTRHLSCRTGLTGT
jgi:ABC-type multidrug transport system ATPase subunit